MMNDSLASDTAAAASSTAASLPSYQLAQTDEEAQQQSMVNSTAIDDSGSLAGSGDRLVSQPDTEDGANNEDTAAAVNGAPTFKEALLCFAFFVIGNGAAITALLFLDPHMRPMPIQYLEGSEEYVRRLSNNEIYQGETLNSLGLVLLCILCPYMIQMACNRAFGQQGDIYRTICTYCVAVTLTMIATEFIKNYVGYLRPIYFDQCEPDAQYETCTGGDEIHIKELHKSFVSGHASFAFMGGTLLTMFLERTFGLSSVEAAVYKQMPQNSQTAHADPSVEGEMQSISINAASSQQPRNNAIGYTTVVYRKDPGLRRMVSVLALLPMFVSIWAASTRIVDNMHFPADVVGGAVLGGCIAAYCHPLWFPDPRFVP